MTVPVSEREAREALLELCKLLSILTEGTSDAGTAKRSLSLLNRYIHLGIDEMYSVSLDGDLAKGIGDWAWSEQAWASLDPLIHDLSAKVARHVSSLQAAPNNPFKPKPLRRSA